MSTAPYDARRELDAYLRNDFVAFTEKVFLHLNPGRSFVPGWYIRAMAYYVGAVAIDHQTDRLNINLPPRSLKSTMISVALPAFLLGLDPTIRIAVASYSQELSNLFGRQTRSIMQSDWYRRLFPSTVISPRRFAEYDFHTTQGGFRFATSTGGTFTGRGGDVIICDDLLKADDAYSDTKRKAMLEWTRTTLFNRLDDKGKGVIINVQQRLHEDDLAGNLIAAGGWLTLTLSAIAPFDETVQIGKGARRYYRRAGEPLDGERETLAILEQTRRDIGSVIFSAQYLQAPTPADGDVVKMGWFRRYDALPAGGELIMSIDTASKAAEHNDYSAISVWRIVDGRFYLEHVWRDRVDFPRLKHIVREFADIFQPDVILVEDKVAGTQLIQDFAVEAPSLPMVPYMPQADKESRLRFQAAKIEVGLVYLPREADWLAAFEEEVRQFPRGKHDDMVDSMSQLLDYRSVRRGGDLFVIPFGGMRSR